MSHDPRAYSRVNELCPELTALHSLNFATAYNAPARGTMMASHFTQRPVISGSEPNLILTGVEEEFGKYTFSVKMPEDGVILKIISRYETGIGGETFGTDEELPETLVIYRSYETGIVDCFSLPYYLSNHPTFGFKYEQKPALSELAVGRDFLKDTVFLDSPAVKGEHHYTYGRNLNVIYMSHPSVGLDGYMINEDALPYFKFRVYENRSIDVGANSVPLNLFGDDKNYKPFPEIGEYVKESGLLMATRKYDPYLAPALFSRRDLQKVNHLFDNRTYARAGKGKVVDISVIHSKNINRQLPKEMTGQLEKYANAGIRFHREIVKFEEHLIQESKRNGNEGKIDISPALQRLLVTSKGIIDYGNHRQPLQLVYKREPLDTWRITFTIEYEITPGRGNKFTCISGGKGVICRIEKAENMPVDDDGNVADIVSSPDSVPGRMNLGRMYAPYFAGAARDVRRQILEEMGFDRYKKTMTAEELANVPKDKFEKGINTLLLFYSIVSPRSLEEYTHLLTEEEKPQWQLAIFNKELYIYAPIDFDKEPTKAECLFLDEMVVEIEKNFKLTYGQVNYVGRSGNKVRTINKFRIAPLHMMFLDKIADSWLSCDIGKSSNFGVLAALNQGDKHSLPYKKTPPRTIGVTEGRLYANYGGNGPEMIAEMMDRSGNLASQREISNQLMHAENPMAIERIVDRDKIPLGNARPGQMLHHIFRCTGFDVVYAPEMLK